MSNNDWIDVQMKAFTRWCNSHLKSRGGEIESCIGGLSDGINLCKILMSISQEEIKFNNNPRMRIHKIENCGRALKFIEDHDVKLAGVGPEEVVDENVKMTLGLIWTLILRFVIAGLSEDGLSAKQGLLLWCQKKTEPYDNVDIQNFTNSWNDGLGFCALIHRHRPDIISMDGRDENDSLTNLNEAFDIAESELGVTKLLDAEDIADQVKPDEKSIMAYVAQLYQCFSGMDKIETAARRVNNFLSILKEVGDMAHDYEERTKALQGRADEFAASFADAATPDDYSTCLGSIQEFRGYRKTTKRELITEEDELAGLFQEINVRLKSQGLAPYTAPEGLSVEDTSTHMGDLDAAESARRSALNNKLREIQEKAQRDFADLANAFHTEINSWRDNLASLGGDLEAQLAEVQNIISSLEGKQAELPAIQEAETAQEAAGVEVNLYTDHTYDDIEFELSQTIKVYKKTSEVISSQIAASQSSGDISAEQMQDLQDAFNHFDEDGNGTLGRLEFKSCLGSLGVIDVKFDGEDAEFDAIWATVSEGAEEISFDSFTEFMKDKLADRMDVNQLTESFSALAGGRNFFTDDDLARAGSSAELVEFVQNNVPTNDDGYDYGAYLASQFV